MAEIEAGGSKGRRVNVELNLVPFIDLMSVLITFLLLSAVWVQINMIQMGTSFYAQKDPDGPPPEPPPHADVVLKVDVKQAGYVFTLGRQVLSFPNAAGQFDDPGLLAQLQKAKELYPNKVDAILAVADELPYERMIFAMDLLLKTGFPKISLATGNP
ncbi:MAG: ExbD/TolR family protein [Bdellovibrionales bacterium]